jgi:uncharacterized membrane protein YjgN (DUF898 family)
MNDTSVPQVNPAQAASPIPEAPVLETPVTFLGQRSDYIHLLMRGALLELVTLGFYRFWLNTDIRRHLWSNTAAGGDGMEYVGTAKELLIGFLFALAILVPIYLAYFFITIEAEHLQAFASIPLVLFFYLFAQFAVYRARRYRLTRTIWRGVRFWMTGSGVSFAWRAGLWSLLVTITLGFLLPWYAAALERYKMRHTAYGDLVGRFDGTGGGLFKRAGWIWIVIMISIVAMGVFAPSYPAISGLLGLALVIAFPFFYALYKSAEWRWWVSGIRFGEVQFESKLRPGALIGLYWKVIGWSMLLTTGLSMVWGIMLGGAMSVGRGAEPMKPEEMLALMQDPLILIGLALGYIAIALAFGVVVRLYLRRDVWVRVALSTTVHNLAAAHNVVARGEASGAIGEGLADSLDVGGF